MNRLNLSEKMGIITISGIIVIVIFRLIISRLIFSLSITVPVSALLGENRADNIIEFLILITAFFYILKLALAPNAILKKSPVDLPILGFLFISALSLIYSINQEQSARSLLLLFSYVLFFYLVLHTLDKAKVVKFCALLVGLAVIISLQGIYEYFFLYRFIEQQMDLSSLGDLEKQMISLRRVGSVFGWPNRLAGFLGMTIPVSLGLFFSEKRFKFKIIILICTLIMLLAMLFTFSIGGWFALIAALFFAGILCFWLMGSKLKAVIRERKFLTFIISLFLIITLIGLTWVIIEKRATPVTQGAIKARIGYLKGVSEIIKDNLFLGTGLGTFKFAYPRYMPPGGGYETRHAHNSYLEIWSEIGIGGLFLFLIFIGKFITVAAGAFSKIKTPEDKFLLLGLFTGVSAFLIHNTIEFTFYSPKVSLYWWLLLGLLLAYPKERSS